MGRPKAQEEKVPFGVRLARTVREAGEQAAADDNRRLGPLMEKLLVDHLRANGYLPKAGRDKSGETKRKK